MIKLHKEVISGSLILLIAFGIFNLFNFVFQFSMARLLSLEDYGILAALTSIFYIIGIFSESIQTVITNYSSRAKDDGKIKNIIKRSLRKSLHVSVIIFVLYLILAIFLSDLLRIPYWLISLNGLVIFTSFLAPVPRGALLGKKMFSSLGLNVIIESVLKLVLGVLLVFIGWRVYGALAGSILALFIAFFLSFIPLKKILSSKEEGAETTGIYGYTKPIFFTVFALLLFYNLDVILAKVFFEDSVAGAYAIISLLGKIIFFGTSPISKAMFPLSSESHINKKEHKPIFTSAFFILTVCIIVALLVFYFFPEFIIVLFAGKTLGEVNGSILFIIGVASSIIAFTNLIILYKLSVGKHKYYPYIFLFVILEVVLLSYFSHSILSFSLAFLGSSVMFLIGSILLLRNESQHNSSGPQRREENK